MGAEESDHSLPRSMRHRQVLDVAEEHPDASVDELASMVPSATPDLVESVLDEHGDPAADGETPTDPDNGSANNDPPDDGDDPHPTTAPAESATATDDPDEIPPTSDDPPATETPGTGSPAVEDLPEKHRQLLAVVAAHPHATQEEIANHLNVTRSTVSRWATDIEGFEWTERESFVKTLDDTLPTDDVPLDDDSSPDKPPTDTSQTNSAQSDPPQQSETEAPQKKADLETRLTRLEDRIATLENAQAQNETTNESVLQNPELAHKIVHACMNADTISETEELQLLKELLE